MGIEEELNAQQEVDISDALISMKHSDARPMYYWRAKRDGVCERCGEPFSKGDLVVRIANVSNSAICHFWHWVYVSKRDRATGTRLGIPAPPHMDHPR